MSHSLPGTQPGHLGKESLLKSIIPSLQLKDNKTGVQGGKEASWGHSMGKTEAS